MLLLLLLLFEAETKALRGKIPRFRVVTPVEDRTKRAAADTNRKERPPEILWDETEDIIIRQRHIKKSTNCEGGLFGDFVSQHGTNHPPLTVRTHRIPILSEANNYNRRAR